MAPRNDPAARPGDRPERDPGQTHPGEPDTVLGSGQDVRRKGYYLNAQEGTVRYYRDGDTIPSGGDDWYLLTEEPDVSLDELREIAGRHGLVTDWDNLHIE